MKFLFSLLFLFFTNAPGAEVLKFDITGYKRELFSYKQVCEKMGHKDLLLVEPKNVMHMDCMGEIVNIKEFCAQVTPKEDFLRGYINLKMKEVVCTRGKAAFLSIACDKRDKVYCEKPKEGCERLNKVYAAGHELEYHTFIEKDVDNVLNCFFQVAAVEKKKKPRFIIPGEEETVIEPDLFSRKEIKKSSIEYLNAP